MLVHAAIVPPREAREAVDAVVRAVPAPVEAPVAAAPATPPPAPKGILGRLGRRREEVRHDEHAAPHEPPPAVLDHVPIEDMWFPVTGFGNLTTGDANRLADSLTDVAASWSPLTVRLAGGTALDFPGDWSVWSKVGGDVDGLMAVARGVTQSVEQLNYYVDRRAFRPMLSVATVTRATTGPYLEQVVAALEAFEGEEWPVEVTLTKETFTDGQAVKTEFRRIRVGG